MSGSRSASMILMMSCVVTGNMLGAGILALPIKTGLSGLLPTLVGTVVVWALMLATALVFVSQKSLTTSATADLPTFFQRELGSAGKWISVVANLILLYGLLTAYISGAGAVLETLFEQPIPIPILMVLFFVVVTSMAFFGMAALRRGNTIIMILMWATFLVLVLMTARHVDTSRFSYKDWPFLPAALPIVVCAFHFHNIIPSICRSMNFDYPAIRKSILIGTVVGLVMNVVWTVVVLGGLPLIGPAGADGTLDYAFRHNLPATIPLGHIVQSKAFVICALAFALLAMSAAYMANGTALASFIRDLTTTYLHTSSRWVSSALAFGPPLVVALVYPAIFLKAIDLVGGVGIDVIFGILPGVLVVKQCKGPKRLGGVLLIVAFAFILVFECGQEFGFFKMRPDIEYHNVFVKD